MSELPCGPSSMPLRSPELPAPGEPPVWATWTLLLGLRWLLGMRIGGAGFWTCARVGLASGHAHRRGCTLAQELPVAAGLPVVRTCPRVTGCRVCSGSGLLDSRLVLTGWTEDAKMALTSSGIIMGGMRSSGGWPSAPLSPGGGLVASCFSRSAVHHLQLFKVISALKFIRNVICVLVKYNKVIYIHRVPQKPSYKRSRQGQAE